MQTQIVSHPAVLIACEQSQTIATAFRNAGMTAFSLDILPCYGGHPEYHIIGDALLSVNGDAQVTTEDGTPWRIDGRWDMVIAHPPCTYLSRVSSVALSKDYNRLDNVIAARDFFLQILNVDSPHVCVENPIPMRLADLPRPTQWINPNDFGHKYTKKTGLWLRNLPPLLPTHAKILDAECWLEHCSNRPARRAKTFEGIANAMVSQWSRYLMEG